MKFIILILFCTFALQNDTVKIDTVVVQQSQSLQKGLDEKNSKLDSIIAILQNDTINKKH